MKLPKPGKLMHRKTITHIGDIVGFMYQLAPNIGGCQAVATYIDA